MHKKTKIRYSYLPSTSSGVEQMGKSKILSELRTCVQANIEKAKAVERNGFRTVEAGTHWDSNLIYSKATKLERLKAIDDNFEAILEISASYVKNSTLKM